VTPRGCVLALWVRCGRPWVAAEKEPRRRSRRKNKDPRGCPTGFVIPQADKLGRHPRKGAPNSSSPRRCAEFVIPAKVRRIRHPREGGDPVLRTVKSSPREPWSSEWIDHVGTPIFHSLDPRLRGDDGVRCNDELSARTFSLRRRFFRGVKRPLLAGKMGSPFQQSLSLANRVAHPCPRRRSSGIGAIMIPTAGPAYCSPRVPDGGWGAASSSHIFSADMTPVGTRDMVGVSVESGAVTFFPWIPTGSASKPGFFLHTNPRPSHPGLGVPCKFVPQDVAPCRRAIWSKDDRFQVGDDRECGNWRDLARRPPLILKRFGDKCVGALVRRRRFRH